MTLNQRLITFTALSTLLLAAPALSAQATTTPAAKAPATAAAKPAAQMAKATPQTMGGVTEEKAGLFKKATITPEAATATALARVPGGKVQKGVLEQEHGKLIYSFEIKSEGKAGIDEVNVDAKTGKVVSKEHESDAVAAKEAAKESKSMTKPAAAKPAPKKP
jgi:uncharacterized membrane protein YkoI